MLSFLIGPVASLEHSIIGKSATQSMTTPQQSMDFCQLTMYGMNHFRGESITLTENTVDLSTIQSGLNTIDFDNKVASVKIVGSCCWNLYNNANFMPGSSHQGFIRLIPGDYPSVTDIRAVFKKASSAKKVNC